MANQPHVCGFEHGSFACQQSHSTNPKTKLKPVFECKRCGYRWLSRTENPRLCPSCRARGWRTMEYTLKCLRCNQEFKSLKKYPSKCASCGTKHWDLPEPPTKPKTTTASKPTETESVEQPPQERSSTCARCGYTRTSRPHREICTGGMAGVRLRGTKLKPVASLSGECTHHWVLELPDGPVTFGTCKKCGERRAYATAWIPNAY